MQTILFCPWFGPFPAWWSRFISRINAAGDLITLMVPTDQVQQTERHANVRYSAYTLETFAEVVSAKLGIPFSVGSLSKRGGYKLCDLRPMFSAIFEPSGFEYWGWIDSDMVLGNWNFVLERAAGCDIYSTASTIVNGPLTILRDTPRNRFLFRTAPDWQAQAIDPEYRAFDEIGFTEAVKQAEDLGLVRFRAEYSHSHSGQDQRTVAAPGIALCQDGRLIDTIQEREVAFFHFPHWKQWPKILAADGRWHPAERVTGAPRLVLPLVWSQICPGSVVDFGCNVGEWTATAAELGAEIIGVDGNHHAERLLFPRENFRAADLTKPLDLGRRFDLAICLEVAEHLPEESADTLVATIAKHSRRVLWSAAPPGQGGYMHVNCQPRKYWADKFAAHGLHEDPRLCATFQALPIPSYYASNLTIFAKAAPYVD